MNAPQYLFDAATKPSLPWHDVPLIRATEQSVQGYGCLVDDPAGFEIEITRWPQQGWRPIDDRTAVESDTVLGCADQRGVVARIGGASWRGRV